MNGKKAEVMTIDKQLKDEQIFWVNKLKRTRIDKGDSPSESVDRLFEAQVKRTPDAVALVFNDRKMSYAELDARANRLAHYLRGCGVGPEVLVGLCVERSFEMIIGLLALLKAGGAVVPLDPTYPRRRLEFILGDAGAHLLLTQENTLNSWPEYNGKIIYIDGEETGRGGEIALYPGGDVNDTNLAYVIYTSGSTGAPKGVMIERRSLSNLARAQVEGFRINADSRVLQFASLSFDASMSEIFTSLTTGAALCLETRDRLMPGDALNEILREQAITVVTLPPTALAVTDAESLPDLKTVVSAGERCLPDVANKWRRRRCFINAYGPTEGAVCATMGEVVEDCYSEVSIGDPINNVRVYVLDGRLRPAPTGVVGELYIGGIGVARGYLRRADMTAERFIPDPLDGEYGGRLYRTGDLARCLEDGKVEYVGRTDHQVKIRGYRVELGEIESLLTQRREVRETVVTVREDQQGGSQLVAYVVFQPGEKLLPDELRGYLRDNAPEYMAPSAFVILDRLPLSANGKVDRTALPAPDRAALDTTSIYIAPRTPTEKKLADIWAEVLHIDRVGAHDHFFDLGGHSLLAIQMISRIREVFEVELPLRTIFTSTPTLEGVALAIDQYMIEQADPHEIDGFLRELEGLSEEQIEEMLKSEGEIG